MVLNQIEKTIWNVIYDLCSDTNVICYYNAKNLVNNNLHIDSSFLFDKILKDDSNENSTSKFFTHCIDTHNLLDHTKVYNRKCDIDKILTLHAKNKLHL